MKRRELLRGIGAGWLLDQMMPDARPIQGRIMGASHRIGHLLRGGSPRAIGPANSTDIVIVGSGVSGLSAAWRLRDLGLRVHILDLEPFAGGTSTWSDQGAVPHPWGAHYLPVPERGARTTQRLLAELGVISGWDAAARPIFDAKTLCHAPEERIHYRGEWHRGLIPWDGLSSSQRAEMVRFRDTTSELVRTKGRDGRYAFASPAEQSSRDPQFLELDHISMAQWLDRGQFNDPFLRWYVEYGTRDDYGANLTETSAWAGLHYFSSRRLESEQLAGSRYLVWPEGNGWLVRQLLARLDVERSHGALVTTVQSTAKNKVEVVYLDTTTKQTHRIHARAVILAIPGFVAQRISKPKSPLPQRTSSPWLVANLHVTRPHNPFLPWDSIMHESPGLGYVDATHQLTTPQAQTVLSYYRAYGQRDVRATRSALLKASWHDLTGEVIADLGRSEPELIAHIDRLDLMIWGHGMPRPVPGFLGSAPFAAPRQLNERIAWAHVDQSGIALFEEANLQGVRAAEHIADVVGAAKGESWL